MDHQVTLTVGDLAPALRLVVVLIEGLGAVNFINWLKGAIFRFFGIELRGQKALALTLVVAVLLSVGTLVIEGKLTGDALQWQNVDQIAALILVAAKARYDLLKRQQEERPDEPTDEPPEHV